MSEFRRAEILRSDWLSAEPSRLLTDVPDGRRRLRVNLGANRPFYRPGPRSPSAGRRAGREARERREQSQPNGPLFPCNSRAKPPFSSSN
ncbi:hypothetical protein EYF80_067083 [Liparis tanakae]|uniref:Uncharacterized protein n=1 Tax=Liparis tanakae TaxID=230148 RepID=A0A4Z2E217_9TELE|nr:hypothetical protein EYF80_067083 [Liparis tanakae]